MSLKEPNTILTYNNFVQMVITSGRPRQELHLKTNHHMLDVYDFNISIFN